MYYVSSTLLSKYDNMVFTNNAKKYVLLKEII